jgi:hypothetical protein
MLDDSPLPLRYDVDECVAIPVDPSTLYVYWEVRARTLDYVRASRPDGVLALRVVVITPTWEGPRSAIRDHDVYSPLGDFFVRELPAGCVVRVAVGYRQGEAFVSISHSPALETPAGAPSHVVADGLVRWTVAGAIPLSRDDPSARPLAAPHLPRRGAFGLMDPERYGGNTGPSAEWQGPAGSSERWAER